MNQAKAFEPRMVETFRVDYSLVLNQPMDRRDGSVYVYSDIIRDSVNIALATGRPLLVRGDAGSGKSTLASSVARLLKWPYYEAVITSRIQARDLQWSFDAVRRLADAETKILDQTIGLYPYIEPEILWWAFDPVSATTRGLAGPLPPMVSPCPDPGRNFEEDKVATLATSAVVLLDEIDKADPDVPNDLLVVLGSLSFTVREIQKEIIANQDRHPLVIITTNEERDLPPAFLRRCVQLMLPLPSTEEELAIIAQAHFGSRSDTLYEAIAAEMLELRSHQMNLNQRPVSTAEYLDSVRACLKLDVRPGSTLWTAIRVATLAKGPPLMEGH